MKTLRWIAPVTVLLGLATGAHAQDNGVVATFVGTPEDVFYDATATSDGGVVAVGYTTRVGAGGRDILLVKADPCGDLLWRKTLGGSADEEGRSVIELPGGDLAITGHTSSVGGPGDHLLISRLDASGHEIWTRVLTDPDGNPPLRGYDLVQDSNGDLIVTGTIWDSVLSIYSMLLAKFGSNGTFVAAAAYREYLLVNWDLWGESTIVDLDDNYIVVGGALHPRNGRWVLMARIRPNLLTVDWSRFLQEASGTDAVGHGAAATSDGKFILTGQSSGSLFISKREHTDPPVANWQKKISAGSAGHNIIQTSTSGFVVAGELGTRVLVGSWNADGSAQWIRGWGQGIGYGAAEDIENRLWVAGANGADALLAKLDPNGFSCYDMHTYTFDPVDWNPTEDVRDLGLHALLSLEVWPWTVDTANVSLQPNYDCDDECTEACWESDFEAKPMGERVAAFLNTAFHFFGKTRWNRVLRLVP